MPILPPPLPPSQLVGLPLPLSAPPFTLQCLQGVQLVLPAPPVPGAVRCSEAAGRNGFDISKRCTNMMCATH